MLPMLCLQYPEMYNVLCTTTQILYVRLMENGPVSSSASLTNSGMFYVQLTLRMKTALKLSVCYLESYKQLALVNGNNEKQRMTEKELWEKTMIIMTDSVEKDPCIENFIATELSSRHIPLHLLYKAHTVEALDISNINVLARLESRST